MHTIIEDRQDGLFTVGYQDVNVWRPLQDFVSFHEAAALCSWLNGGLSPDLTDRLINATKIGGRLA